MLKALMLLTIASLSVLGCNREDSPRMRHDATNNAEYDTPSKSAATSEYSNTEISAFNTNVSEFAIRFKVRLDASKLQNESRAQTKEQKRSLFDFVHEAAQTVEKLSANDANRKSILQSFMIGITAGCDEMLKGCRNTDLFRRNPEAVTLLMAYAKDVTTSEFKSPMLERYRALQIAFTLVGAVDESRVKIAYLETARLYEAELKQLRTPGAQRRLQDHYEIVEQILTQLQNNPSPPTVAALEKSYDIWNFSRPRNRDNVRSDEFVLQMAAQKLFTTAKLTVQLQVLAVEPQSIFAKISKTSAASRKAFGLPDTPPANVMTLIFDNIWLGRLTPREADILWSEYLKAFSKVKSSESLREQAKTELLAYARMRMLTSAKDVNSIISELFSKQNKILRTQAFEDALKEGARGKTMWVDFQMRFALLRQFDERNLRTGNIDARSTQELSLFFASIPRNIKMTSTYPSMLILCYHLARVGFSFRGETLTGSIEILPGEVLDRFFEGNLTPWTPYSDDHLGMTKSEMSTVFYYALEMGDLTEGGVDLETMFKLLTEQMLGSIRAEVERNNDIYKRRYEDDSLTRDFYRFCSQNDGRKAGAPFVNTPNIKLDDLQRFLILGMPQGQGDVGATHRALKEPWSFFGDNGNANLRLDEMLEILRLELTPKINRMRVLARMTDDYMLRHQLPNAAKLKAYIESKIVPLEKLRARSYSLLFSLNAKIGACGEKLASAELLAETHVINGLIAHFRQVHQAMSRQRTSGNPGSMNHTQFGFANLVKLPGLKEHEAAMGFSGEIYRVSKLQILLKISSLLEDGYSDEKGLHASQRERGQIIMPTRLRDLNEKIRSGTFNIPWSDDADEFVAMAMQPLMDLKNEFIWWDNIETVTSSMIYRIRALATLAKAGSVQTDSGMQKIDSKELIRATLVMEKWLEVENTPWANVLNLNGQYSRFQDRMMLNNFAWEPESTIFLGLLDLPFAQLTLDKLGDTDTTDVARFRLREGPMEQLKKHALVTKSFGKPALAIPPAILNDLTKLYTETLDTQLQILTEMMRDVRNLAVKKQKNPEVFPSWRIYSSRKSPSVPLVTGAKVDLFRTKLKEFSRETGYQINSEVASALDTSTLPQ